MMHIHPSSFSFVANLYGSIIKPSSLSTLNLSPGARDLGPSNLAINNIPINITVIILIIITMIDKNFFILLFSLLEYLIVSLRIVSSCFSFISSPFSKSFRFTFKISERGIKTAISGKLRPLSHLLTALSEINNLSARSF